MLFLDTSVDQALLLGKRSIVQVAFERIAKMGRQGYIRFAAYKK